LVVILALCVSFALVLTPACLSAQTQGDVGSKSQQAAEIARQVDTLDRELEPVTEAYNQAEVELDAENAKVDESQRRLDSIGHSLDKHTKLLDKRVVTMFEEGRTSLIEVLLQTKDIGDFLEKADLESRVAKSDQRLVTSIKSSRDDARSLTQQLGEARRRQSGLVESIEAKKIDIEAKLQERQNTLNSVNAEIQQELASSHQDLIAGERVLNDQAQSAFLSAPADLPDNLARTALKFLGVPYVWAASGPDAFDCSGLTMYVYGLFGIDLPHNAAMQFNMGLKIPLQKALPGDLVFFGMPPHHVGMYLGNDLFIEAPCTGDVVKVSRLSARSDCSGVCRFWK
jgi:cell wall-associated NlpC family hydrolase